MTREETMRAFKDGFDPWEPPGTPIDRQLFDVDAMVEGRRPRKLADVPLWDVIEDLAVYIRCNAPGAAIRLAEMALARGSWIAVCTRDEGYPYGAPGEPLQRYLVADRITIGRWTPATASMEEHDLLAVEGAAVPANAALAAVVRLVQEVPAEDDFDLRGSHAVFCFHVFMGKIPFTVSFHSTAAGATRAAQRRNVMDPGTAYEVRLRADL